MSEVQLVTLGAVIKTAYESQPNTNAFTDADAATLASLPPSARLGVYSTLSALQAAHPSPLAGTYGVVDAGANSVPVLYVWDGSDNVFRAQNGRVTSVAGLDGDVGAVALVNAIITPLIAALDDAAPGWRDQSTPVTAPNSLDAAQSVRLLQMGAF